MLEEPEPNGEAKEYGDLTVVLKVCSCCKDPKPTYFVRNLDGKLIRMAYSLKAALGLIPSRR